MADTIYNEITKVEITPHVMKTYRTPSLSQIVNTSLSGLTYVQTVGAVTYQTQVDFVIHKNNDSMLVEAWKNVDLMKIIDDNEIYYGYIIDLRFDNEYANDYHSGSILIQEERVE